MAFRKEQGRRGSIIEMFSSLIVLSRDLGSVLLRKSLSQNTQAADLVVQALRDRKELSPDDESNLVQTSGDEVGVFLEMNDVVFIAVVEEEVNEPH